MANSDDMAYVFDYDNEGEAQRMKWQHERFLELAGGNLLPPMIDMGETQFIADIATGTGEWLADMAKQFGATTANGSKREYYGFDINSQVFHMGSNSSAKVSHVVHDMTKPFPTEFHGKFNLVHIRLTFIYLKDNLVSKVMRNISQLLAPGGYLVWTDVDPSYFQTNKHNPQHLQKLQVVPEFIQKMELSLHLHERLKEAALEADMNICSQTTYSPLHYLSLQRMQYWEFITFKLFLPNAYPFMNRDCTVEEAKEQTEKFLSELQGFFANGEAWDVKIGTLTARKPL